MKFGTGWLGSVNVKTLSYIVYVTAVHCQDGNNKMDSIGDVFVSLFLAIFCAAI